MSSYFANNYIPDLRNGGVVSADHPHQHQHYGAAVVAQGGGPGGAVTSDPTSCAGGDHTVVGLRQGIPPHHYGGPATAGQPPQGMPYPRFPPYDRMDIRNAAYYGAQQQSSGGLMADGNAAGGGGGGYRANSPSNGGMGHLGGGGPPNGHQTPVVYASCKLQAAAVGGSGALGSGSPPLEGPPQATLNNHSHQNHHHSQQQHANHQQGPPQHHMQANHQHQHPHHNHQAAAQNHLMYNNVSQQQCEQGPPHHQQVVTQQTAGPQPPQQPPSNTASTLPSPLYPWMRSQFGEPTATATLSVSLHHDEPGGPSSCICKCRTLSTLECSYFCFPFHSLELAPLDRFSI